MFISIANYLSSNPSSNPLDTYQINKAELECLALKEHKSDVYEDADKYKIGTVHFARDRSFNYGDGCFTTIYAQGHDVHLLEAHIQRLCRDSEKLGIHVEKKALSIALLYFFTQNLCLHQTYMKKQSKDGSKVSAIAIKVLVSRGEGTRGYQPAKNAEAHIFISFQDTHFVPPELIFPAKLHVQAGIMRLSVQPLLAGLKHNNRLEQVLAKKELMNHNVDDLLLSNQLGKLIETTAANVFLYIDGVWHTPELDTSGVAGVMRNMILRYMQAHNIAYKVGYLRFDDVFLASAMFTCNALSYIKPVSSFSRGRQTIDFTAASFPKELNDFFDWSNQYTVSVQEAK
jgi:4-amino-4-deoxychorismate lyase